MSGFFHSISNESAFSIILSVVLVFIGIGSLFILQPEIPLWYSLVQPEDQMVSKPFILFIPLLALLISLIHFVIIKRVRWLDAALIRIVGVSTLFVVSLLAIAFVHILLVVL